MHRIARSRTNLIVSFMLFTTAIAAGQSTQPATQPAVYAGQPLVQVMKRVMEFQVKAYGDTASIKWEAAPFWAGVMAAYNTTSDEEFLRTAKAWAQKTDWKISQRYFHADDTAVGQAYEEMYLHEKDPKMIADLQSKLEQYLTKTTVDRAQVAHGTNGMEWNGRNVWWWCDALFMAPPALARMGAITGDKRYFQAIDSLWWDTTEYLFDNDEGLYFRDDSYFFDKKQSPTGKKIFWGRGNGWVYGGIIRTLDYLPQDHPQRQKYLDLYRKMTDTILKYQGQDGMWRASINEPTWISQPESSCTGFFTFGLLAGINRGYLDREKYLPHALRGWRGLNAVMRPDGGIGYAQQVSASPEKFTADSTKEYAQGAFLLAASELYKLKPTEAEIAASGK